MTLKLELDNTIGNSVYWLVFIPRDRRLVIFIIPHGRRGRALAGTGGQTALNINFFMRDFTCILYSLLLLAKSTHLWSKLISADTENLF